MKRAISVLAPLFLVFVLGVVRGSSAQADAPVAREARTVDEFHAITVAGTLEVAVTVGQPARVEISGEADLIGKVTTTVKDGVLVLDTPKRMHRNSHLRATVTVPQLDAIAISGTSDMKVTGVASARFAVNVGGTGHLTITGSTGTLSVSIDGTGQVEAETLPSKDVRVDISGTGQASVRASKSAEVTVAGTGSIDLHGNPAHIKKSVTGTGAIQVH